MNKKRIYLMAGLLFVAGILILITIIDSPSSDKQSNEVSLRASTQDVSIDDMIKINDKRKLPTATQNVSSGVLSSDISNGSLEDPEQIAKVQALIKANQENIRAGVDEMEYERNGVVPDEQVEDRSDAPGITPQAKSIRKKKVSSKTDTLSVAKVVPQKPSPFNSVSFGGMSSKNAVKAYVHSEQTVTSGSTLKMRLGEDAVTDNGVLILKNSPIFGEVTKVDGERVIVKITHINYQGSILPFEKEVYSKDALLGIYVPGNVKADANKDVLGGALDGLPSSVPGLDAAAQIAGAVANSAVAAGKQVTSKNLKKVKVTIKTNYEIYLRPEDKKQ